MTPRRDKAQRWHCALSYTRDILITVAAVMGIRLAFALPMDWVITLAVVHVAAVAAWIGAALAEDEVAS